MRVFQLPHHPVVERPVILELQRADGMGDSLYGVLNGVSEIIHGVDAPCVSGIVMIHVRHTVNDGIAHIDVGRGHVDAGPQHLLPVPVLSVLHLLEQLQILLHRAGIIRVVFPRLGQASPVFTNLLRGQVRDIGLALFDQLHRRLVHLPEIIGGEEQPVLPVRPQPLDVLLDGFHEFDVLLGGVGVIEAHVEFAVVLPGQAVVQKYALGMSDMQVAVGLRREAGVHGLTCPLRQILVYDHFNKISGFRLAHLSGPCLSYTSAASAALRPAFRPGILKMAIPPAPCRE